LLALAADAGVLLAFFYVALGAGSPPGQSAQGEGVIEMMDARTAAPDIVAPGRSAGPGLLKAELEGMLGASPGDVGIAVLDSEGDLLLGTGSEQPFVLASVAKVYILAAYLDQVHGEDRRLTDEDVYLLQAMIRYSDNDSASTLWNRIGEEAGLAAFLGAKGIDVVTTTEEGAWGTLNASARQVGELLWQLAYGDMLDPESRQVALSLLADVEEEQAWGISAGAKRSEAKVFLKNGWYPEEEGWRVNSAGLVETAADRYVLVVLVYPASGMEEGVRLIESIAGRVNRFMAE
jgi:hypothetical protein